MAVALIAMAIAAGWIILGHVDDSGFWIISKNFFDMTVEQKPPATWTGFEAVVSVVNFAVAAALARVRLIRISAEPGGERIGSRRAVGLGPRPGDVPIRSDRTPQSDYDHTTEHRKLHIPTSSASIELNPTLPWNDIEAPGDSPRLTALSRASWRRLRTRTGRWR